MIKEALKYFLEVSSPKSERIGGYAYSDKHLHMITEPTPEMFRVKNLSSLVEYVKHNRDDLALENLMIVVEGSKRVFVHSALRQDQKRDFYIEAIPTLPQIDFGRYFPAEDFIIMIQSLFANNGDKDAILKVVGNLKDEAIKQLNDDGVSQKVTVKTGIATIGEAVVPNPVCLHPFCTFTEILQPARPFIFRMRQGGQCALFEADAGMWENEVMEDIADYLKQNLQDEIEKHNLTILC